MVTYSNLPFNLSPKVANPTFVLLGVGLLLVILGVLLKDDEVRTLGLGALGSALVALPVGYRSSPGDVVEDHGPGSDAMLGEEAVRHFEAE